MKRTLLEVYCLVVSFFALAMIAFTLGKVLINLYYYIDPIAGMDGISYERYESNEKYFSMSEFRFPENVQVDSDFITTEREKDLDIQKKYISRNALQAARYFSINLAIIFFIFLFHWHFARKISDKKT